MLKDSLSTQWTNVGIVCATFFFLAGGIWFALTAVETSANPKTSAQTISVTGEGKTIATPDLATVSLGYSITTEEYKTSAAEAEKVIANIYTAAEAGGVSKEYITQTQTGASGGNVNGSISVTFANPVDRTAQLSEFLHKALTPEKSDNPKDVSVYMNNICLSYSNLTTAQAEGRAMAIASAEQKATEFAQQTGHTLGKVVQITDNSMSSSTYGAGYGANCYGLSTLDAKYITPQPLFVSTNVTFELK